MNLVARAAAIVVTPMLLVGTVFGQLSSEDIAALRAQGELEGWTFTVGENDATKYSLNQLCGWVESPNSRSEGRFDPCFARTALPESFDWRDYNGCTPVRNQLGCGSCWAFGAVGIVESAILRSTGVSADLSEQWLVSCTPAGSCEGGSHTDSLLHMLHMGQLDYCNDYGAVLEQDFPYVAYDAACSCPYPRPYAIQSWAYVAPGMMPSPSQIKQAILDHGPVAVTVHVNDAFQAYDDGVFNACVTAPANHVVVLVGWDDNQGVAGVWIMRNSWGPGWGEDGYMRIQYGCSGIGDEAVYVDYPPDCNNNGQYDHCDLDCDAGHCVTPCGQSSDCNFNGVLDECEPDEDCNGNGIQDICDIGAGTSENCNGNDVPDECEPDCDGSGIPDDCEMNTDCNNNGVQDLCDLAYGTSADCNGNGWPDECDLTGVSAASGELSPIGRFSPQQYTIPAAPPALGDVSFYFTAIADLNLTLEEWIDVDINGVPVGQVFILAYDCPTVPNFDGFEVPAETFNAAVNGGDAVINMVATNAVNAAQCVPYSYVTVAVDYDVAEDCTGNGILDECEPDCNDNGVADSCDILDGTCGDADGDVVPDECDNCDLYNPDQLDCQDNGVGDVCDVAYGTSLDTNGNGVPDECDGKLPAPERGGPACMPGAKYCHDQAGGGSATPCLTDADCLAGESCWDDCWGDWRGADCIVYDNLTGAACCYIPKNRHLTIDPAANDTPVAYQVIVTELDDQYDRSCLPLVGWLGDPVCREAEFGCPVDPQPPSTDACQGDGMFGWVSYVVPGPVAPRMWTEYPLVVAGREIVAAATYEIRGSTDGITTREPPLIIPSSHNPTGSTQHWGDVTSEPGATIPWKPPEYAMNFADVSAVIMTFEGSFGPPPEWSDIEIDHVVNFSDVSLMIQAFEGKTYPEITDIMGGCPSDPEYPRPLIGHEVCP